MVTTIIQNDPHRAWGWVTLCHHHFIFFLIRLTLQFISKFEISVSRTFAQRIVVATVFLEHGRTSNKSEVGGSSCFPP
jgi:hypothetical protein